MVLRMNGLFQVLFPSKISFALKTKTAKYLSFSILGLALVLLVQESSLAKSALEPLEDTFETLGETLGYGMGGADAVNLVNILEVGYGIILFIAWFKMAVTPLLQGDITAPFVALVVIIFVFMCGSWLIGSFLPKETQNVSLFCKMPVVKDTPACKNVNKNPNSFQVDFDEQLAESIDGLRLGAS